MSDAPLQKVADDDPDRCQAVYANGQCHHRRMPNSDKCRMHAGSLAVQEQKRSMVRQYNVTKWRSRIDEFAGHESVKSLREEIGIIRLLLETTLNLCESDMDLLLYSNKISDLVTRVESLVRSCHKLESSMGMLMDRMAVLQLSGEVIEIISRHISNEDVVKAIADEIGVSIARIEASKTLELQG